MSQKGTRQAKGMVDIGLKPVTARSAKASGVIQFSPESMQDLLDEKCPKGNVLETAKIAGIMAAKATPQWIPMCHPLELNKVNIRFEIDQKTSKITVIAEVSYSGRTGVEMEALTAVSASVLTIYDMMKWSDKGMIISDIKLLEKSGGQSGDFKRT